MTARRGNAAEINVKGTSNGGEKITPDSCEMLQDRQPVEHNDDDEVIVLD